MRKVGDGEWCDGLACGAWRERYGHVATRHYYLKITVKTPLSFSFFVVLFFCIHIYIFLNGRVWFTRHFCQNASCHVGAA